MGGSSWVLIEEKGKKAAKFNALFSLSSPIKKLPASLFSATHTDFTLEIPLLHQIEFAWHLII